MGAHELAMIKAARPAILAGKAREWIENEICKGCRPDLSRYPVALEPLFEPAMARGSLLSESAETDCVLRVSIPSTRCGAGRRFCRSLSRDRDRLVSMAGVLVVSVRVDGGG